MFKRYIAKMLYNITFRFVYHALAAFSPVPSIFELLISIFPLGILLNNSSYQNIYVLTFPRSNQGTLKYLTF